MQVLLMVAFGLTMVQSTLVPSMAPFSSLSVTITPESIDVMAEGIATVTFGVSHPMVTRLSPRTVSMTGGPITAIGVSLNSIVRGMLVDSTGAYTMLNITEVQDDSIDFIAPSSNVGGYYTVRFLSELLLPVEVRVWQC
jgi:hypothetical protein